MADLISIVTSKPNWQEKISDGKIVKKWRKELVAAEVNPVFLDLVIKLLKESIKIEQNKYDDDNDYKWILDPSVNPSDVSIDCKGECECEVCQGNYNCYSDSDYCTVRPTTECKCTEKKLRAKKEEFMMQFIQLTKPKNKLIHSDLKSTFKKQVCRLEQSIDVDYHPGTNNQVIDLVHPSMYCYVNGIAKTKKEVSDKIIFQWLPAEFSVSKLNGDVTINSPINNLDRDKHDDLYNSIGTIFCEFVPKFNKVLKNLHKYGRVQKAYADLSECQVIVKLAKTVLTPDSPTSPPGSWHLEGLPNEKIIATGIYYHEMKNITHNYLQFRSTITDSCDINYPQNCSDYVTKHYGFEEVHDGNWNTHESFINLGQVETSEDMCIVFPNFMQHRVSQFSLVDPTKDGVRSILVFFLVDPNHRILSTADVKPQQSYMSEADAKIFRELLMFQRKYEMKDQTHFFERGWSLCEH